MTTMKQGYPELEDLKRRMEQQVDSLKFQLDEMQKHLESVNTTLSLLRQQENVGPTFLQQISAVSPNDLRGLTQLEALTKIAKANNNRLKVSIAKQLLLRANVTKSRKNANNIIFNVITRSEKFRRVAPGEYELIEGSTGPLMPKNSDLENVARAALLPSKPIQ